VLGLIRETDLPEEMANLLTGLKMPLKNNPDSLIRNASKRSTAYLSHRREKPKSKKIQASTERYNKYPILPNP
jgi:hypothetical protein